MMRATGVTAALCVSIVLATRLPAYGVWTWTTLDYPAATHTEFYGISGDRIVGAWQDSRYRSSAFLYDGTTWTTLAVPGASSAAAYGISGNDVVGGYLDGGGSEYGFHYDGTTYRTLQYPGAKHTEANGISGGIITGWYYSADTYTYHGFVYDGVSYTNLDYPGATSTHLDSISTGRIIGHAQGSFGYRGFVYDGTTWTTLAYPSAFPTITLPHGIAGASVVGAYSQSTGHYGFLFDGITWTTLSAPDAPKFTYAYGISGNTIAGYYYDSGNRQHGFLLTIPEPATLLLLALGGSAVTWRRVRRIGIAATLAVLGVLLVSVEAAQAVNIEMVTVGNPGNAPDTEVMNDGTSGYGAVGYTYNIGKYEVTAGQYCEFLNAVAKTDTYGLYNTEMWSGKAGCKIERTGASGNYTYSVAPDWANRAVSFVSYWDACRFANWLHNGQPTDAQGAGTTETGAYTLNGYNGDVGQTIQRNAGWKWAVTSEDEWYKAAYHKNDGVTGNYWDYPTSSDSTPSNQLIDPDPGNNATFWPGSYTIGPPYYRTEVGAHENSDSPYGTFDQGGNVWEWNESIMYPDDTYGYRGFRGGAYGYGSITLHASIRNDIRPPSYEVADTGFRVVQVPEPATLLLMALGGLALTRRRVRRIGIAATDVLCRGTGRGVAMPFSRAACVVAIAVFWAGAPGSVAGAAGSYAVIDLGTFGGRFSQARDINNRGQVVGYAQYPGYLSHAFLYDGNGPIHDLGELGGGSSVAQAINESGQVVGVSQASNGFYHGFLYAGAGPMQDLGTFGGPWSRAADINNSGQIVGYALTRTGAQHAFRRDPDGRMYDLGTLGTYSEAIAINDMGQIIGNSQLLTGPTHAFAVSGNGPMMDLGTLDVLPVCQSYAAGINSSGQIIGYSETASGIGHGFLQSPGGPMQDIGAVRVNPGVQALNDVGQVVGCMTAATGIRGFLYDGRGPMQELPTLGGYDTLALDINNSGQIVGYSYLDRSFPHAFLYENGQMIDLNSFLPPEFSDVTLTKATLINDRGFIVARGLFPNGDEHAFLLTPEPASLLLLPLGGLALMRRRRPHC